MERSGARQYDKHPELSLAEGAAFICALSNLCQYSEARMVDLLSILYGACQRRLSTLTLSQLSQCWLQYWLHLSLLSLLSLLSPSLLLK